MNKVEYNQLQEHTEFLLKFFRVLIPQGFKGYIFPIHRSKKNVAESSTPNCFLNNNSTTIESHIITYLKEGTRVLSLNWILSLTVGGFISISVDWMRDFLLLLTTNSTTITIYRYVYYITTYKKNNSSNGTANNYPQCILGL